MQWLWTIALINGESALMPHWHVYKGRGVSEPVIRLWAPCTAGFSGLHPGPEM